MLQNGKSTYLNLFYFRTVLVEHLLYICTALIFKKNVLSSSGLRERVRVYDVCWNLKWKSHKMITKQQNPMPATWWFTPSIQVDRSNNSKSIWSGGWVHTQTPNKTSWHGSWECGPEVWKHILQVQVYSLAQDIWVYKIKWNCLWS